jgi:hypothetical protein
LVYFSEFGNNVWSRNLSDISQVYKQGTNDDAKVVNGQFDLYTQLQQESLQQRDQ